MSNMKAREKVGTLERGTVEVVKMVKNINM